MIRIDNLAMVYGTRVLFQDVNFMLNSSHRYGLVGANGTGKSTFLKLLAGQQTPHEGTIIYPKHMRTGWLKQDQFRYEDELVLNVVLQGKVDLWQAFQEKTAILSKAIDEQAGYRLAEIEEIIMRYDGYNIEPFAEKLLIGLGIKEEQIYESLSCLSGGYKLRVLLAQALFNQPDILMLDEPNNYLDILSIAWLESYLKNEFKGLLIFTSHDQDFLNNVSTDILDIDYGEIRLYAGNYDTFLRKKEEVVRHKMHEREYLEKKIARWQIFIERFRASPSRAKQSLSKEKMIERIELPEVEKSSRLKPNFSFSIKRPSGKHVLKVSRLTKQFDEKTVLHNIHYSVARGEKIAIIGKNSIGKSTLLNIIMGYLKADYGNFAWGFETHISYFAQEHNELAQSEQTVFQWLCDHVQNVTETGIRKMLGAVLLSQDDVHKKLYMLSGGEITRLLFAKMMLEQSNVLILDEPTNHLDIESRDELAHALKKYEGTVIFVSHDRHFVTKVATRIIGLTVQGAQELDTFKQDFFHS